MRNSELDEIAMILLKTFPYATFKEVNCEYIGVICPLLDMIYIPAITCSVLSVLLPNLSQLIVCREDP